MLRNHTLQSLRQSRLKIEHLRKYLDLVLFDPKFKNYTFIKIVSKNVYVIFTQRWLYELISTPRSRWSPKGPYTFKLTLSMKIGQTVSNSVEPK